MFDFFRKHTRLFQFVLVLLIFPSFVFFGIQGYSKFDEGAKTSVATVDGRDISQTEWDNAWRNQVERVRQQMPGTDPKLFDTPEMRNQSLEALVRERVMLAAADRLHLTVGDERLARLFAADPQFASLRNADGSVNRDLLAAQGMSSETFAGRLRQDLSMRQVIGGISSSAVAPAAAASSALDALFQQREIQVQRFNAKDELAKLTPNDADVAAYYNNPANATQFQAPEQVDIEYVVLDAQALQKDVQVSEDDMRKYYTENAARYTAPEERRASHILVKAEKTASAAQRTAAKAKAESMLAQAKKNPSEFAALARQNSDDPGSAQRGGDLDFFSRGAMVKPFEDVAFALRQGELSNVVESDFGYHIILLTGVRGGTTRSFDAVRPELEADLKQQRGQKKFDEAAAEFTNLVEDQSDSLQPVAEKFKLTLQHVKDLARVPAPQASGPLASPKFLDALFAADTLRNKRNTQAVETSSRQLVSGHVLKHVPAHLLPLSVVKAQVQQRVAAVQAAALARRKGEAALAAAKQSPQNPWPDAAMQTVSRMSIRDAAVPRPVVDAVLRAAPVRLPTVMGIDLGDEGYALARVVRVLGRDPAAGEVGKARSQYAQAWGEAESQAYYAALKSQFKVQIKAPQPTNAESVLNTSP